MTSSKARRGVMLSTALRPVMPKRRENVLGPTRYTIPCLPVRINAAAPILRTCPGRLLVADSGCIFLQPGYPEGLRKIPISIVERLRSLSGQACLSSSVRRLPDKIKRKIGRLAKLLAREEFPSG